MVGKITGFLDLRPLRTLRPQAPLAVRPAVAADSPPTLTPVPVGAPRSPMLQFVIDETLRTIREEGGIPPSEHDRLTRPAAPQLRPALLRSAVADLQRLLDEELQRPAPDEGLVCALATAVAPLTGVDRPTDEWPPRCFIRRMVENEASSQAIEALATIGPSEGDVRALQPLLSSPDIWLAVAAAEALATIEPHAVEEALWSTLVRTRKVVVKGDKEHWVESISFFQGAELLGRLNPARCEALLTPLLRSKNNQLVYSAAEVLAKANPDLAVAAIERVVRRLRRSAAFSLQDVDYYEIFNVLVKAGTPRAISLLHHLLQQDPKSFCLITSTLARIGTPAAMASLHAILPPDLLSQMDLDLAKALAPHDPGRVMTYLRPLLKECHVGHSEAYYYVTLFAEILAAVGTAEADEELRGLLLYSQLHHFKPRQIAWIAAIVGQRDPACAVATLQSLLSSCPPDTSSPPDPFQQLKAVISALGAVLKGAMPKEVAAIAPLAAQIRVACRGVRPRSLQPTTGFDNRGLHSGRHGGPSGEEFYETAVVPANGVDPRAIDWGATDRLHVDPAKRDLVVVKRYIRPTSIPTLLVIDPRVLNIMDRTRLAALVGTIACYVQRRQDPVGVMIGSEVLPPAHAAHQLESILWRVLTAVGPRRHLPFSALFEAPGVRRHLRPGTTVVLIGDLITADPTQLERLASSLTARRVKLRPVAVRRAIPLPLPQVTIGPGRWKLSPVDHIGFILETTRQQTDPMQHLLHYLGTIVNDVIPKEPGEIIRSMVADLEAPVRKPDLGFGEIIPTNYRYERPEPGDLVARLKRANAADDDGPWMDLLEEAIENGWPTPLRYAKKTLITAIAVARIYEDNPITARIFGSINKSFFGSTEVPQRETVAQVASAVHGARKYLQVHCPSALESRRVRGNHAELTPPRVIEPRLSGVTSPLRDDERARQKTLLRLSLVPPGRGRYLRASMGIYVRGTTLVPLPDFGLAQLAEAGSALRVAGKSRQTLPDRPLCQPVGGRVVTWGKKDVVFAVESGPLDHPLLHCSLADLKAQGPARYGEIRYRVLTEGPSLGAIAGSNPALAREFEGLLTQLHRLPVGVAIGRIRDFVTGRLRYRAYDDQTSNWLWEDFLRRSDSWEAQLIDYLRLIFTLGGGKCQELAIAVATFLRLAGIPTGLSMGWYVQEDGRVGSLGHAWAEVVLPRAEGPDHGWIGLPVEASAPYLAADDAVATMATTAATPVHTVGTDPAAPFTGATSSVYPGLTRFWSRATQRDRVRTAIDGLDLWLSYCDRPFWHTGQTGHDFLAANFGWFLDTQGEEEDPDFALADPGVRIASILRLARQYRAEEEIAAILGQWERAVETYFGGSG